MDTKNIDDAREEVWKTLDHSNMVCGLSNDDNKLIFGDYVISGINTNGDRVIGYVVQIRKKWGAFGSDMFFVRDTDGNLATHENQSFWKLTPSQIKIVKPFFKHDPFDELAENPDIEYTVRMEDMESGFIVTKDNAPDRVDTCAMTITTSKAS